MRTAWMLHSIMQDKADVFTNTPGYEQYATEGQYLNRV